MIDGFDGVYFPTYAGALTGWYLRQALVERDDATAPILTFQNRPDMDVELAMFDFVSACVAALADPAVWVDAGQDAPSGGEVRIIARQSAALGSLVPDTRQEDLVVSAGTCTLKRAA